MKQVTPATSTSPNEVDDALDRMLNFSETCKFEGASRWTVRREIKAGRFPPGLELINGREGWPLSWLKARREKKARRPSGADAAPETAAIAVMPAFPATKECAPGSSQAGGADSFATTPPHPQDDDDGYIHPDPTLHKPY